MARATIRRRSVESLTAIGRSNAPHVDELMGAQVARIVRHDDDPMPPVRKLHRKTLRKALNTTHAWCIQCREYAESRQRDPISGELKRFANKEMHASALLHMVHPHIDILPYHIILRFTEY